MQILCKFSFLRLRDLLILFQGIGSACPNNIDSANNDLTGREIRSNEVKELIVQLHNEVRYWLSNSMKPVTFSHNIFSDMRLHSYYVAHAVKHERKSKAWILSDKNSQVRSKIARGACDQPKAGCMGPVVSSWEVKVIYK